MAGGYTLALPEEDRTLMARKKLMADMVGLLGGRAAEELVFDDITSGASNDLERVTRLARAMVTRLGMSNQLGPMVYGQKEELIFLGREISEQRDYSEAVAEEIDSEVRRLVADAYNRARQLLIDYRDKLDAVAKRLLEVETISQEEFEIDLPAALSPQDRHADANGGLGTGRTRCDALRANEVRQCVAPYVFMMSYHLIPSPADTCASAVMTG